MALQPQAIQTLDDRTILQKMRRVDVQDMLRANGIDFDPLAPKDTISRLLELNGIDPESYAERQKTEDYRTKRAQRRGEKYLDAQASGGAPLPARNHDLEDELVRIGQMPWAEVRNLARGMGVAITNNMKRREIEEKIKERLISNSDGP